MLPINCVFSGSSSASLSMTWSHPLLRTPLLSFECLFRWFACLSDATFQSNSTLFSPSQRRRFFFLHPLFGEFHFCTISRYFSEEFSAICWLMRKIFPLDAAWPHWVSLECYTSGMDLSSYLKHPWWFIFGLLEVFHVECCSNLTFRSQCWCHQCPKSRSRFFEQIFTPSHQASQNHLRCHNLDSFMST